MEMHNISVVVPAYNREKTIKRCLDSIMCQSYQVVEVIVVDDGSADRTLEVIEENYGEAVRVIKQKHQGAQAARNAGIKAAKGEYIVFLDSDDCLTASSISDRLGAFEHNADADMVYGDAAIGRGIAGFDKIQNYNPRQYLLKELSLCPFSVIMVRRSVFETIPLLDTGFKSCQDDDFIMQLALNNKKMFHCGRVVAEMHSGSGQITSDFNKLYEGIKRMVKKYRKQIAGEVSCGRLLLWKIRVLRAWLRKRGAGNGNRSICLKAALICLDKICLKFFRHLYI